MNGPASFETVQQPGCEENKPATLVVRDKYTENANKFETFLHPTGEKSL